MNQKPTDELSQGDAQSTSPRAITSRLEIKTYKFPDLTGDQVAAIYEIRYNIFVQEQQSIYDEHDGNDKEDTEARHLLIEENEAIIAYARVYRKSPDTASLGRVAVVKVQRKEGHGKRIILEAIETARSMNGVNKIEIGAQTYLQEFYESLGFEVTNEPYDDDGVMHIDMTLSL